MNKIQELQKILKKHQIDAYIVPTSDFHESEYVSDYFKTRAFLSGFLGSNGTLLVSQKEAFLWTDGRYFIQAAREIEGSGIILMKMGEKGVPTLATFLSTSFADGSAIAFDGRVMNAKLVESIVEKSKDKKFVFKTDKDLVDSIWKDRPSLPKGKIFILEEKYSGKSYADKIKALLEEITLEGAEAHIISSLEDQAWLFNLRGNDVRRTPVFLAFTLIVDSKVSLYVDKDKLTKEVKEYLQNNKIKVVDYNSIYSDLEQIKGKKILLDETKVNYQIYSTLAKENTLINKTNPTLQMKAIKNDVEVNNMKKAQIIDAIAMIKFIHYLKNELKEGDTELSVQDHLEELRKQGDTFVDLSFDTICAYKSNAAMMHYSAKKESAARLTKEGLLLVDSGAHYLYGTTDITRTIALGKVTDTERFFFTAVLKSLINLASAKFLKGTRGLNLDILARGPIWDLALDYKCGTGHGIGYLLSVHEAPNGFRWQVVPERNDSAILLPGMITTDEPGVYLENELGVRHENELLTTPYRETSDGVFYQFETITFVPIDLDAIDVTMLDKKQIAWLNNYHKDVYDNLSPYFDKKMKTWLKKITRPI